MKLAGNVYGYEQHIDDSEGQVKVILNCCSFESNL